MSEFYGKKDSQREKYRGDFVGIGQQTAGIGGAVGVQTCGVEPDIPQICIRPLRGAAQRVDSRGQRGVYR